MALQEPEEMKKPELRMEAVPSAAPNMDQVMGNIKQNKKDFAKVAGVSEKKVTPEAIKSAEEVVSGAKSQEDASDTDKLIAKALLQIVPTLAGAAIAGAEGGAAGAAAGQSAVQAFDQTEAAQAAQQAAEKKAQKEQLEKDEAKAFKVAELGLKEQVLNIQREKGDQARSEKKLKLQSDLRKERNGLPTTKDTQAVVSSYEKVKAAAENPSAAGDLSIIFNFMKMLDPGSVVREGEFANAQNAAGIPERVRAQYNNAIRGERLTENTRADFLSQAQKTHDAQIAVQQNIDQQFLDIAQNAGLDGTQVLLDFNLATQPQKSSMMNTPLAGSGPAGIPGAIPSAVAAEPNPDLLIDPSQLNDQELDALIQRLGAE